MGNKPKIVPFRCWMPPDMLEELRRASVLTNKSQAALIREAVAEHLARLTGTRVNYYVRGGRSPRDRG